MLEVLGLSVAEEIGLLSVVGAVDIVLPELIVAEALVLAGVFAIRAVMKHHRDKQNQPEQPAQIDQDEPEAPENLDDDVIEENKQIDAEVDKELDQEGLNQQQEEDHKIQQYAEREERLDQMRQEMGVNNDHQNPDEVRAIRIPIGNSYFYFPIGQNNNDNNQLPNQHPNRQNSEPDGGPDPDGDPNGGNNDPNDDDNDEIANPYNDNQNRNINPNQGDMQEILKQSVSKLATQYYSQLTKEKEEQKQHEEGKISDTDFEQLQAENEQIKNQLELQKQTLDILDAIQMNEITDEQSLVQLEKIDQDIRKMQQKQVQVGDVFSTDLVTF